MNLCRFAKACIVVALGPFGGAAAGQTFHSIHSFSGSSDGFMPIGDVVFGPDGAIYGATSRGGAHGQGTVFRLDTKTGSLTVIYNFPPKLGLGTPNSGVVFDSSGNMYGAAVSGGANNQGAIYELARDSDQAGYTASVVYSFSGVDGPGYSVVPGPLAIAQNGLLYGVTTEGGVDGYLGTIYQLDPASGNYVDLHDFTGGKDGAQPVAAVTIDNSGLLYGTTMEGEGGGYGTIFTLDPTGDRLATLRSFTSQTDAFPTAGLLDAGGGIFYGTTSGYGRYSGIVFSIDAAARRLTTLHRFTENGGWAPRSGLAFGADGSLYGTTVFGGNVTTSFCGENSDGCGTIFALNPTTHKLTTLHKFSGRDGAFPGSTLVMGSDGAFYGTTSNGGRPNKYCAPNGCGTVFRLIP